MINYREYVIGHPVNTIRLLSPHCMSAIIIRYIELFVISSVPEVFIKEFIMQINVQPKLPVEIYILTAMHNNSMLYSNYYGARTPQILYCMLTEELYWGVKQFVTLSPWSFGSVFIIYCRWIIWLRQADCLLCEIVGVNVIIMGCSRQQLY